MCEDRNQVLSNEVSEVGSETNQFAVYVNTQFYIK
jgi:hypothetical protein